MSRRVVFDTSTLLSAALRYGSIPHQALLEAIGAYDLCATPETLDELERVIEKSKFDAYLDRASRSSFVVFVRHHVHLVAVDEAEILAAEPSCRDPKDNQFLALALVAEADVIVSSDQDLLVMNPWNGVPIVTPAEFLSGLKVSSDAKE